MGKKRRDKFRMPRDKASKVSVEDAVRMAVEVHQRGLVDEAMTLYKSILDVVPDHIDALHFLGVANHQLGNSEAGIELINKSLKISPNQPSALNNLGNINKELGNVEEAETAYRRVLELAPDHVETLSNLAVILRLQKKTEAAHALLKKALKIDPKHSDSYHNLGNIYRDLKRNDDALIAYRKSVEFRPDNEKSSKSIAKLLFESGRKKECLEVLKRLLLRNPEDAVAAHMLVAYGGGPSPERASDDYVRQAFDDFAVSFDSVLEGLEYAAPKLVAECLRREMKDRSGLRIVDLGCGTGLLGPLVRPIASSLIGVDLSEKMLAQAEKRAVYDEVIASELTQYLRESDLPIDVLTCVDTLVYFGALEEFSVAANRALQPGGWLFFSVESHDADARPQGYILHPHGRYSHSRGYVEDALLAAGLQPVAIDDVVLRLEREEPVKGMIVAAQKPSP
jgi:predicted TPR repeat methyltransferase